MKALRIIRSPWAGTQSLVVARVTALAVKPWLMFLARSNWKFERRRLRTVPEAWAELADAQLILLYHSAERATEPTRGDRLREIEGGLPSLDQSVPPVNSDEWISYLVAIAAEHDLMLAELAIVRGTMQQVRDELVRLPAGLVQGTDAA